MKEQLQIIMETIVMPVVASLGGFAGIVAIITSVAKVITSTKTNNKAITVATDTKKEVSALLNNLAAEFQSELERRLNCQFRVDFSAKLNEELGALERRLVSLSESQNVSLAGLKTLMTDIAQFYSTSRNLTEEERLKVLEHISAVNALITAPKEPELPKDIVTIEYKVEKESEAEEKEDEPKRQTLLRGI